MAAKGTIYGINGPIVYIAGDSGFQMNEMVYVGKANLVGEVIGLTSERTTIEVYEETTGLKPGEPVTGTGAPVSVTLAPGIITNIFDGIERPLAAIKKSSGYYIDRGVHVTSLDTEKKWQTHMTVKRGDHVYGGTIIAEVPETRAITHKVMIPPDLEGDVLSVVSDGEYTINDTLLTIMTKDGTEKAITMTQKWPIRIPRPTVKRYPASKPLITGQRILDTLFPLAKGGTAAIPGGFGTGKTMTQHQIAKWSDADIIIYIGCGERGNEMTQVLEEFSELIDPKSGNPLMERTTLIANTSNMPVAAREASLYSGLTLAEYYRDMGYNVAIMADSTSRWAEALRELSGRLEEMPAEEGFPAYLASLRAGLMNGSSVTWVEIPVTVFPEAETLGETFAVFLGKLAKKDLETGQVVLPETFDGRTLHYRSADGGGNGGLIFLGIAAALCLFLKEKSDAKEAKKQWEDRMILDYPELLLNFVVLTGAGYPVRQAWKKQVMDAESKNTVLLHPVYREMRSALNQMETGTPEIRAYGEFGRRIGLGCYIKFASLLGNSVSTGGKDLRRLLEEEMETAFRQRKELALRKGEEASTKLLIPMFLMLGGVMVMVVSPAFLAL